MFRKILTDETKKWPRENIENECYKTLRANLEVPTSSGESKMEWSTHNRRPSPTHKKDDIFMLVDLTQC